MFEELPPELEDLRQQVVKNGYSVRFTDGVMRFRTKRGTATVDGVYANGEIVVNARSAKWATEQLVNHEMFHGFARENDGLVDAMVAKVFGDLTDAQIEEIVAKYQEAYKGAGLSRQQALEEICADAFAGMDRKNIGLAGRTEAARRFVGERVDAQAVGEHQANATRAGPAQTKPAAGSEAGDGKYSIVRSKNIAYKEQIHQFFDQKAKETLQRTDDVLVLPKADALKAFGFTAKPVFMLKRNVRKVVREKAENSRSAHGISEDTLLKIPEILEDPALVITKDGRLSVISDVYISTGRTTRAPLLIGIDTNSSVDNIPAYEIKSIYGIDDFSTWLNLRGRDSEVFLGNKKKASALLRDVGLQLPEPVAYAQDLTKLIKAHFSDSVNPRFSMSSPVEETDTLIALHNMDEEKLRRTLTLGAWPSPSIAIVEAKDGHTNYGEYSAVFPRSTIDPQEDPRNRVYGADAWTPTHSNVRIEREVNYDVLRSFEKDVERLANQIASGIFSSGSVLRMLGIEDQTEYDLPEIARRLADQDSVKAAYLADHGEDIEVVYREKVFDGFGIDKVQEIRSQTLQLYFLILGSCSIGDEDFAKLGIEATT